MSHAVGDRTELVDTGRHETPRRPALAWLLLAGALAAGGIGSWVLWEGARLARDESADWRRRVDDANLRAAAAENQILALSADHLRGPSGAGDEELAMLAQALRAAIDRGAGDVRLDAGQLVVTLVDPGMFRGDDAELTPRGDAVVAAIAGALGGVGDRAVWVHGHVDDAPLPEDAPFETAWELSSARALAIVRALADRGVPARRLAAVAFGAERPAGKDRAKNRRVEIVVDPAPSAAAAAMRSSARNR